VPTLPSLYGVMLAGVDYILMGAGIPKAIPGILDKLAQALDVEMRIDVKGSTEKGDPFVRFSPTAFAKNLVSKLPRPKFLAIVSSHVLAKMLATKSSGEVDGFVVEYPVAGGHNAPPRAKHVFDDRGQPVYGERDVVDLANMRELGVPFWLAGGYGSHEGLREALAQGAAGIQVGTLFAYCRESGIAGELKEQVLEQVANGGVTVRTDPRASPTGFPFKVVEVPGSASGEDVYSARRRVCDLGYLREVYRTDDGTFEYRCPAEPVNDYVRKGGDAADTVGRKCLCNALLADVGLGQVRGSGASEPPLLTSGDDFSSVAQLLTTKPSSYSASDVVEFLLDGRGD